MVIGKLIFNGIAIAVNTMVVNPKIGKTVTKSAIEILRANCFGVSPSLHIFLILSKNGFIKFINTIFN